MRTAILLLFLSVTFCSFGQKRSGLEFGYNSAIQQLKYSNNLENSRKSGLMFGYAFEESLSDNLYLNFSLQYVQMGIQSEGSIDSIKFNLREDTRLHQFQVPMSIGYDFERFGMFGGVWLGMAISGSSNLNGNNEQLELGSSLAWGNLEDGEPTWRRLDYGFRMGGSYYLFDRLRVNLIFSQGFRNQTPDLTGIGVEENYSSNHKKLQNSITLSTNFFVFDKVRSNQE